jgi:hypothetical protein
MQRERESERGREGNAIEIRLECFQKYPQK